MGGKNQSSSTGSPGYYSQNTASYDNSLGNYFFGGLNPNGTVGGATPGSSGTLLNGGASGGLIGNALNKAGTNQVYTAPNAGFSSPTYSAFNFTSPQQSAATLSPDFYKTQENNITQQGNQEMTSADEANKDNEAYSGAGGGNITNYENQNEQRNVAQNEEQENNALQGNIFQTQFANQANVNAANQQAGLTTQSNQANNNLNTGTLNSQNNQFGTTSNLNYLAGQEGEQQQNTGNLNNLLSLVTQYAQGFAQKPTTSSSSSGFTAGPSSVGLSFPGV